MTIIHQYANSAKYAKCVKHATYVLMLSFSFDKVKSLDSVTPSSILQRLAGLHRHDVKVECEIMVFFSKSPICTFIDVFLSWLKEGAGGRCTDTSCQAN
jgi:hypothetical protein